MTTPDPIDALLGELQTTTSLTPERLEILRGLLSRVVNLVGAEGDIDGLRVAATALDELLVASTMFSKWRDHKKLAVFGSARTKPDNPLFELARVFSATMAKQGWMTVTGAGPGIMEASAMGAGKEMTLGVNIDLPFEQFANPYIDAETMLVAMRYFFTRKVAMTRPSNAFAVFPGGLGTMDEVFEVLTLLHTGKTTPAPVVLLDTPEGTFWEQWLTFIESAVTSGGYIGEPDMALVRICHNVDEAVHEIEHFYSNYVSFAVKDARAAIRLRRAPTPEQLSATEAAAPSMGSFREFVLEDDHTVTFAFDGRDYVNLRLLINRINAWSL